MTQTQQWQQRWRDAMIANYGTPAVALVSGQGAYVVDADGVEYLDFLSGIAVNALGHAHPAVASAVSRQASELMHVSNLAIHPRGVELAERLKAISGWDARVFFSQDGATANEAALKIARRYGYSIAPDGSKQRVVAMQGSFHGRTMGALAVTGNPAKRDPFAPFGHDVSFVPFGDVAALEAAMGDDVVAVILEPAQGENGVVMAPQGFLQQVRDLTNKHQALMIVDEVQSGIGRTGEWFACKAQGVTPDIMTLAKGLGGGMPIGAVLTTGVARDALQPGDHGTTFGGNPVSCAAALAVIDTIESEGLLASARVMGASLRSQITQLKSPRISEVRGMGLWIGIVFDADVAAEVEFQMRAHGVLVNAAKPNVLRIAPPLIITEAHISQFVTALGAVLADMP